MDFLPYWKVYLAQFFIRKFEKPKERLPSESWFSQNILDLKELIPTKSGTKTILKVKNP
jgi:hypothetical protein